MLDFLRPLRVFLGILQVKDPLDVVGAGLHHFSGTARTEGQDGAQLRHDVHVVPALAAAAAPADVLKAAGHVLLPV